MKIIAPEIFNDVSVKLPPSKSISNRLLIIQALAKSGEISNVSDAEDTQVLKRLLSQMPSTFDVGHAGTAFRFLTAFLSITDGVHVLTGSDRMKTRPIAPLVDALRSLGADIEYVENEGYPPLKISGKKLQGGKVSVEPATSSQFVSALMLIAPVLENGLEITLAGELVSKPYIQMTASLLEKCGARVSFNGSGILIPNSSYQFEEVEVEYDWSAASFWFELAVVGQIPHLEIANVKPASIQGDVRVMELFKPFGVDSTFEDNGLHLRYSKPAEINCPRILDFKETPDLVQPFLAMAAATGFAIVISGTHNLQFKETNRPLAMKNELGKFGAVIDVADDSVLMLQGINRNLNNSLRIKTYQDHRMAMSLAPLSVFGALEIENPEVVQKSYPDFWKQMQGLGFEISD